MTRLIVVAVAAIGLILFVAFVTARLARSRSRGLSIRMQVFVALAAIVGAFALGLGLMVIDRIEARAVRFANQAAEEEALAISKILHAEILNGGASLAQLCKNLQRAPSMERLEIRVIGAHGRICYDALPPADSVEGGWVTVSAPIQQSDGQLAGEIVVFKRTIAMRRLLSDFAPTVLVISLVLGGAAALAAGWIGRAIAAPIEAMSEFSEQVASGQVGAKPPPGATGREVTRLVQSIDTMRRELEGRPFVETFAADLSHELKNPVAAIRASAEVLEDSALEEPQEAARFVRRIRESTERIERLLNELLHLAKLESRGVASKERVDLGKLAQAVVAQGEPFTRTQLTVSTKTLVQGDATWLSRAVRNLLDNALIHSHPDSTVRVAVERDGDRVVLHVDNDGQVQAHVRQNLFRRFVTTRANKGGTGLGLAIIRAVAEAHGGSIRLVEAGPPRVRFRFELPAAPEESALGLSLGPSPKRPETSA